MPPLRFTYFAFQRATMDWFYPNNTGELIITQGSSYYHKIIEVQNYQLVTHLFHFFP